ncbi:MAG: hypothetical protein VB144_07370 [Clostridia bacterium]|nr:hypothetical protein [Clostridia bacterium]
MKANAPLMASALLAAVGVLSVLFGHLIGDKHRFELINGHKDEKAKDADRFARWMQGCFYTMGGILTAGAALIWITKAFAAILFCTVLATTVVLGVMTAGAGRYYRI